MSSVSPIDISVIVPCFNGERALPICLQSLLEQDCPPKEIIVVDDGSIDRTGEIADRFSVRLIRHERQSGAGAARAAGAAAASSAVLAFIDSDCVAPRDWVCSIGKEFDQDPSLGGLGGRYTHSPPRTIIGRLAALEEAYLFHVFSKYPDLAAPIGGNCAYRSSSWFQGRSWKEVSAFRGMGSGEDSVAGSEIRRHSKVRYRHDLCVEHLPTEKRGYLRRHLNRGYSRASIILGNLTDPGQSSMVFEAYGGWSLFFSTVLLPIGLVAVAGLPGVSLACVAAHLVLTHRFFSFIKAFEAQTWPTSRSGFLTRLSFRALLLLRSFLWVAGSLKAALSASRTACRRKTPAT